jgi:hypothetical protein
MTLGLGKIHTHSLVIYVVYQVSKPSRHPLFNKCPFVHPTQAVEQGAYIHKK